MRSEMKGREGKGGHFKDVTGRVSHGNLCQENPGCAHEYLWEMYSMLQKLGVA